MIEATKVTADNRGLLHEGFETRLGVIEAVSLTAYLIDGRWVSFDVIHGRPLPVAPLVNISGHA